MYIAPKSLRNDSLPPMWPHHQATSTLQDQPSNARLPADMEDLPSFGNEKPPVALLQLNKQIHKETVPVFYGENTFRMPANVQNNTTYIKYDEHIHHVSIRIDHREGSEEDKQAANHQKARHRSRPGLSSSCPLATYP